MVTRMYRSRPIVRFSRDRYPELVAYLESLPPAVLGHDINRRVAESFYGTDPAAGTGTSGQSTAHTSMPGQKGATVNQGPQGSSVADQRIFETAESRGFLAMGIRTKEDFDAVFYWPQSKSPQQTP
jgi:hypothetical protein